MLHVLPYPSTTNDFLIEKYDQWHSILVSLLFSTCMVHICVLPPSVSKASYVHHLFFQDLQCGADVSCHWHCIDQPIYSTVMMENSKEICTSWLGITNLHLIHVMKQNQEDRKGINSSVFVERLNTVMSWNVSKKLFL